MFYRLSVQRNDLFIQYVVHLPSIFYIFYVEQKIVKFPFILMFENSQQV